jgi:hypothetical protein
MPRYAVLIDAGFLKRKLGSREDPVDAQRAADFIARLCSHERLATLALHRIYYYDAPPLEAKIPKPLNGGRINFGATDLAKTNKALLVQRVGAEDDLLGQLVPVLGDGGGVDALALAGALVAPADGDGFHEIHINTIEGVWSLLRSWLRPHRGISQESLPLSRQIKAKNPEIPSSVLCGISTA